MGKLKARVFTGGSGEGNGFTLVEALVAMVIFCIVVFSAVAIFKGSVGRFAGQAAEKEVYSEAVRAMEYIGKYLPSAMCGVFEGDIRIDFAGEDECIRFVSPFSEGPESDIAKFAIYFDRESEALKVALQRVDRASSDMAFPSGFSGAQPLATGIREFTFAYLGEAGWSDRWNTEEMAMPCLPRGVAVEMVVFSRTKTEGKRYEKKFTRFVALDR